MATAKTYLVPVDFSKGSEIALKHAIKMARDNNGRVLLVHVISTTFAFPLEVGFSDIFDAMEKDAQRGIKKLAQRVRLRPREYRSILTTGGDTARLIADLAKKYRAYMIIMGSHGRTGLRRLMLGSVAERTLRYAECPVLIVKR
jgi:nucleotide-binding universal stress UspA family protein